MDTSSNQTPEKLSPVQISLLEQAQETKVKLCECGCGSFVNNRFKTGHHLRLYPIDNKGVKNPRYGIKMSQELKDKISKRIKELGCSKSEKNGNFGHHIDYNKSNLNYNNLITLCIRCNSRVNYYKEHWKNYLQLILELDL